MAPFRHTHHREPKKSFLAQPNTLGILKFCIDVDKLASPFAAQLKLILGPASCIESYSYFVVLL